MGDLPNWIYDVVMQLQKWGDEHGNLFMLRYDGAYIPETECCRALGLVPDDVRKHAAVLANYKRGEASDES